MILVGLFYWIIRFVKKISATFAAQSVLLSYKEKITK